MFHRQLTTQQKQEGNLYAAAGIEFIGPIQHAGKTSWNHFRAPDGTIFEILSKADDG
jgi:hypothetical protein